MHTQSSVAMDTTQTQGTCYGGGDIAWTFFGTLICGAIVAYIAWRLYKKYWNARKGNFSSPTGCGHSFTLSALERRKEEVRHLWVSPIEMYGMQQDKMIFYKLIQCCCWSIDKQYM